METKKTRNPIANQSNSNQSKSKNERLVDLLKRVEELELGDDLPRFVEAYTFYMCHRVQVTGAIHDSTEYVNTHSAFMNFHSVLSELVNISKE